MADASGAAKVILQEWDYSDRVPSFPGLYGAIVIPTHKGVPDYPVLITSATNFLNRMTPDETIRVGFDFSHYSALNFLEKSNKLWVVPAAENALYGGAYLSQDKPVKKIAAAVNGLLHAVALRQVTPVEADVADLTWNSLTVGDKVRISPEEEGGTLPSPLKENTDYYVIKYDEDKKQLQFARSLEEAYNGNFIQMTDSGSGSVLLSFGDNSRNGELEYGLLDPSTYQLDSSDGRMAGLTSQFTIDINDSAFNVSAEFYNTCNNLDAVTLVSANSGTAEYPAVAVGKELNATDTYYLIKVPEKVPGSYEVKIARSTEDATNGVCIDFISTGASGLRLSLKEKSITCNISIDPATDAITVTPAFYNTLVNGDLVHMVTNGVLPTVETGAPVTSDKVYFVTKGKNNTIQISVTEFGTPVNFKTAGTGTLQMVLNNKVVSELVSTDLSDDTLTISETLYESLFTGYEVKVSSTGTLPSGLSATHVYYVYKDEDGSPNKIKICRTAQEAVLGIGVDVLDAGIGTHTIHDVHNQELSGLDRKCMLVYTSSPCEEEIYIKTLHYPYGDSTTWDESQQAAADTVKEPGCFLLYVYKKNSNGEYYEAEGPWLMSRDPSYKNGYGQAIYCEDVIQGSNYVRIKDNTAVDSSILPADQGEILKLVKGSRGDAVTDRVMIRALNTLLSKRQYTVTIVMDGGWTTPAYARAIDTFCQTRQDCAGILSVPISLEQHSDYLNQIVNYRKSTLNIDSSYVALYTPHLKISDQFNDREIWVSPSGFVAGAISDNEQNYEIWYAAAGPKYGVLDNVLDVVRRFDEGEEDELYNAGINPIDFYLGRGIRIWGNKTLQSRASALDRLNVRLMLIYIEPAIQEFLESFLFDINDEITRDLAATGVDAYMQGIKARRGVYDYKVKCDSENNTPEDIDNHIMNLWLFVQPTLTIEWIIFRVIITRTGATMTLG